MMHMAHTYMYIYIYVCITVSCMYVYVYVCDNIYIYIHLAMRSSCPNPLKCCGFPISPTTLDKIFQKIWDEDQTSLALTFLTPKNQPPHSTPTHDLPVPLGKPPCRLRILTSYQLISPTLLQHPHRVETVETLHGLMFYKKNSIGI